ncbi:MAG: acetylglutamate kinase [Epsilonproteobacteria bacterium]|nr:acetylglutamate kinase [Campylobacterota bacterium]OIO17994.1 MAG: acetylglutamate kinase [Helicobacteraceae bacterium CG1_02_36_14]PIP10003.1 MAG: acetylglutamate kinase [Sulfurimonas sp. CG23_combo_of_CG06-09_8_20_14_all_36_33]PIS25242.1 MAG: acetylglutamate kinase [Sulfurimonas sp. CG08_land_8_20_14_0_20_36_33]PIU35376.1 MAG: acetylglutamate kinase [Sulfurimonas sp. CG07_land_8_20_14_0_80_36_56]PIV05193.1 MAG: acetylglutamate kinase [Sulfurimonas sp. CG03_land_8_20_14_0_80_36_25]PIV3685
MIKKIETAQTLLEALPYIKKYANETFVIKYGGSAQINPELKDKFAQDIILLYLVGIKPVIVHGGGNKINEMLDKLQIKSEFVDGMRVTDAQVMEVVEMVLSGNINKEITTLLNMHGAKALGITGKDANFITAIPKDNGKYGLVGEIVNIDSKVIQNLIDDKFIPVVAPIASGNEINHPGFNINADLAASKIAASLKARKIIFMTDIAGVMDKEKNLLTTLTQEEISNYKADGTIHGGMIPKVDACLEAVRGGVEKAHIIDGRVEHSILLEIFTSEGVGTVIKG